MMSRLNLGMYGLQRETGCLPTVHRGGGGKSTHLGYAVETIKRLVFGGFFEWN